MQLQKAIAKMRQIAPNIMQIFKNFPGGDTPDPRQLGALPQTPGRGKGKEKGRGRGKEGDGMVGGGEREEKGRKGKGKGRKGKEGRGEGRSPTILGGKRKGGNIWSPHF
jgi:hypothetical protein